MQSSTRGKYDFVLSNFHFGNNNSVVCNVLIDTIHYSPSRAHNHVVTCSFPIVFRSVEQFENMENSNCFTKSDTNVQ